MIYSLFEVSQTWTGFQHGMGAQPDEPQTHDSPKYHTETQGTIYF